MVTAAAAICGGEAGKGKKEGAAGGVRVWPEVRSGVPIGGER
jgi:hypothetical protein